MALFAIKAPQRSPDWKQLQELLAERAFVAMEATNHRGEESAWPKVFEIEGVTSLIGKKRQESQLGSAVAIPDGVNGVQLGEK